MNPKAVDYGLTSMASSAAGWIVGTATLDGALKLFQILVQFGLFVSTIVTIVAAIRAMRRDK